MKRIKTFEKYFQLNEMYMSKYTGQYLELEQLDNGDLKITLTPEGKEEAQNIDLNIYNFNDLFDDIRANSDLYYIDDVGEFGLGMSSAPAITDGYYYNDEGEFTDDDNDDSEIFIYNDYMIKDFTKELYNNGYVIFSTLGKKTQEEIEEIKMNKAANKYNL